MKIAMPVDEKDLGSNVCISFGRTPFFLIYDTENRESVFIDNIAATGSGGAGIKAAQVLVDNKTDTLITPRCGENAAGVLEVAEIKIYKSTTGSAKDNIATYIDGKLSMLNEIHAGSHGFN